LKKVEEIGRKLDEFPVNVFFEEYGYTPKHMIT